MAALAIFILESVQDADLLEQYRKSGREAVVLYGGRPRVSPKSPKTIVEGEAQDVVVIEFDTLETAKAWYASPEYQIASKIRKRACRCQVILTETS